MSRYCGPRVRIIRRLGTLPGFTTKISKRKTTPGDHGKELKLKSRRSTLGDDYRERLVEKQKLRYNYGVTEKQMVKYMVEAKRRIGSTEINFLKLLELRLDCIVFRLGFARTIPEARQLINHGHIQINNKKITIPSFECKINDEISVTQKEVSKKIISKPLQLQKSSPEHLLINKEKLTGKILKAPNRANLDLEVNELKVVEYYSR